MEAIFGGWAEAWKSAEPSRAGVGRVFELATLRPFHPRRSGEAGGTLVFVRGLAGFGEVLETVSEGFDGLLQPFDGFGREVGAVGEDGLQQAQE